MGKPKSFLKCWLLVSWLPLVCAAFGIAIESIRIAAKPLAYISAAKLVAERPPPPTPFTISDPYSDICGTIIETVESSEMRRRASERVRSLQPDLKVCDVHVEVRQKKDSMLFDVRAVGSEPLYTHVFLDALLIEYMAFRAQIWEQQRNKSLITLAEDVTRREKSLADKLERLAAFEKTDNMRLLTGELNRLTQMALRLRDERDEISRNIRTSPDPEKSDSQLISVKQELSRVEKELEPLNSTIAIHNALSKDYQNAKRGYDELLDLVRRFTMTEDASAYKVNLLERASDSVLDFQRWLWAMILGASAGLILSLYFAEVLFIGSPRPAKLPPHSDAA